VAPSSARSIASVTWQPYLATCGLSSIDFCNFDNFDGSFHGFLPTFAVFSTRSFDLNERLNIVAKVARRRLSGWGILGIERVAKRVLEVILF